jgi:hypothetical protein
MNRKYSSIVLVLCSVLLASSWSRATTVQRLGLQDLVKKANSIVVGKVTDSRTYWSANRKLILTDYTLTVDENIKGAAQHSVTVTTLGGKIGDLQMYVSGMPTFQSGENAVVFIERSGTYRTIVGLGQGKFTIANGEVSNNVASLSFPDGRPGSAVRMPLAAFKNQIRSLMKQ